ncbi:hypothetical protein [Marinoscillum sp.]|uniref:hypothetical protein n=1 Tax=Marinoscillum sp. TaxID=2024838 RepID=UPI003BAA2A97
MKEPIIIFILLIVSLGLFGQRGNCSQDVLSKSYLKELDSVICIPHGYIISRIYNEDLDKNEEKDRIVKWFKKKLTNGDTIYHTIYSRFEGELGFFKTYPNLLPLYFDLSSIDPEVELEDSILNELKSRYLNPQATEVKFREGLITIEFQLAAREYQKLYFNFYQLGKTFILTKKELYYSSDAAGLYLELENTETFDEGKGLDIEDFDYLDFLYY